MHLFPSFDSCEVAPFINQLQSADKCDFTGQYLVRFIQDSHAGFIVCGVTVTMNGFLRQMATLTTLVSGLVGVLLRMLM